MCYRPTGVGRGSPGGVLVVGLGIDIVELERVERALARWGGRLVAKLMDPEEAALLPADAPARARALALAIAGKEAASKALGTGWSRGVRWRDVRVEAGPPTVVLLSGGALSAARRLGSRGEARGFVELRGPLALGEVRLLA
ncbi:MAG TPA: 4'-phosphopantetheinyl transferase superfamily protein [Vicinamibacteria bacterium]|nr:4'-phosphopantetheinyl transferase superfamily protein [Vicinamibacteria bacterium]